jgi:hypothetical protein
MMLNRRTLVFTYKKKDSSSEVGSKICIERVGKGMWDKGKECGTKEKQSNRCRKWTNVGQETGWRKKGKNSRGKVWGDYVNERALEGEKAF